MLPTSEDKPLRCQVKIIAYSTSLIPEHIKKNLHEIILEPQVKAIIGEESIELSNNTFDRIHTYAVVNNEYNLIGDVPYS
ncbi:hypothetical protein [Rickettsia endosymbiont of Halotydeus destructor]|uniref:hypothetical protein n=1 Tax=Rickettsia endosymbiont of Halotydeus destructor TaxID=2996754 RepID=UPI003BB053AD